MNTNNSTTKGSKTASESDLQNFYASMVVINAVSSVLASVLNLLIILTFVKKSSLRTPSYILILSLAISDLGVGVVVQPAYACFMLAALKRESSLMATTHEIFSAAFSPLVNASILTVTAITIDRFLALRLYFRYQQLVTTKRSCIVVITIWIVSLSWGVVYAVGKQNFQTVDYIFTLLATLFTIFLMVNISRVLRRHSAQIQAKQQSAQPTINKHRYKKSVNTLYYITGAFVMCYCPHLLYHATWLAIGNEIELFVTGTVTCTLVMLNSAVNPIIYFWRIKEMRNAVLQLMRSLRCH